MSRPWRSLSFEYGDEPGEPAEETRPESTESLVEPKLHKQTVMNLPNTSISTIGDLPRVEDGGEPSSHAAAPENSARNERYEHENQSVDVMDGSYKKTVLGLTQRLPGSVARARAAAEMRLQTIKAELGSRQEGTKASHDGAAVLPPVPTIKFTESEKEPKEKGEPCGKWRCCKCNRGQEIVSYTKGEHPVSVLECTCVHRSCTKCTLEGLIKPFVPMSEPEVVTLSEDSNKIIRFGVFCDGCGLSWRAREVHDDDASTKAAVKSALLRVSALPRRLTKRGPHALERLRPSQSMSNLHAQPRTTAPLTLSKSALNLRALSNEMEKEYGKQADVVSVMFAGIKCDCGMVTDASSLCFQIVDPPEDFYKVQFAKLMAERKVTPPSFGTTPEDQARGHGKPTLTLKGGRVRHPNPLRSNPV